MLREVKQLQKKKIFKILMPVRDFLRRQSGEIKKELNEGNSKMKKRKYTDAEILADIDAITNAPDPEEIARDAYFHNPENAAEIEEQQARMDLVIALYNARHAAGLTQKQIAERIGTKQTYIAQIERGRKNITFATLRKYAAACGKKVAVTLL